jgi:hypothetical protein
MATAKTERLASRPEHQVTGRDYPGEWARQIELYLDEEQRRLLFYGGLFGAFVLCVVITVTIRLALYP